MINLQRILKESSTYWSPISDLDLECTKLSRKHVISCSHYNILRFVILKWGFLFLLIYFISIPNSKKNNYLPIASSRRQYRIVWAPCQGVFIIGSMNGTIILANDDVIQWLNRLVITAPGWMQYTDVFVCWLYIKIQNFFAWNHFFTKFFVKVTVCSEKFL